MNKYSFKKRHNFFHKNNIILLVLLITITFFGIGYSSLKTEFSINGDVGLKSAKWNVYFDNLSVDEKYSKNKENKVSISSDQMSLDFTVDLSKLDNCYEFEVDIINEGSLDAMSSDDVIIEGLSEELKEFINIKITYNDGIKLKPYYLLKIGKYERIKVKVESKNLRNLPNYSIANFTLKLLFVPATTEVINRPLGTKLNEIIKTAAMSDSGINLPSASSDENGKGVYLRSGTEKDDNPIYYYRGEVYNNNIIFAEHCWKIVRTTETGGTKIVYNGVVGENNTCNNTTGAATQIQYSPYNNTYNAEKYFGYTYEENGHQVDSTIKSVIDTWYEDNILKRFDDNLEDTVWCNDGEVDSLSGSNTYYAANARIRIDPLLSCSLKSDKYTLKSTSDKYNSNLKGNELLDYPIALLTADEIKMSGMTWNASDGSSENTKTYLYTNTNFWTLSPSIFTSKGSAIMAGTTKGDVTAYYLYSSLGVRPAVSLEPDTVVITKNGGEAGTAGNPYVVE